MSVTVTESREKQRLQDRARFNATEDRIAKELESQGYVYRDSGMVEYQGMTRVFSKTTSDVEMRLDFWFETEMGDTFMMASLYLWFDYFPDTPATRHPVLHLSVDNIFAGHLPILGTFERALVAAVQTQNPVVKSSVPCRHIVARPVGDVMQCTNCDAVVIKDNGNWKAIGTIHDHGAGSHFQSNTTPCDHKDGAVWNCSLMTYMCRECGDPVTWTGDKWLPNDPYDL